MASLGDLFLTAGLAFFLFAGVVRVPTRLEEHEEDGDHARLAGLAGQRPAPAARWRRRCHRRDRSGAGSAGSAGARTSARPGRGAVRARVTGAGSTAQRDVRRRAGRGCRGDHAAAALPGDAGAGPPTPVCPPRPERLVHRAVGRPAHLPVRRPDPPARAWRRRARHHGLGRSPRPWSSSPPRSRTCSSARSRAPSSIDGTTRRSWSSATSCAAAVVLLIPIAVVTNILLVYPLVFVLTSISIFFRPARVAILPQIVRRRRAADRELGAVGRRDDGRCHRLPAGGALRRGPGCGAAPRLLAGCRDLRRVGRAAGHDRRPLARSRERAIDAAPRPTVRPSSSTDRPTPSPRIADRRDGSRAASSASSRRAGGSCATSPCCWRTPSRRPSPS